MNDNPWLFIPAADYESHMDRPDVDQLRFLSDAFGTALRDYPCTTVAILGCATGNGLEQVNPEKTDLLTAVDINPDYLEITRERYEEKIPGLETVCADLATCALRADAYDLVYAGLVFEYVDPSGLLPRVCSWLKDGGVLVVVLQQPSEKTNAVSGTSVAGIQALSSVMSLQDPVVFRDTAHRNQLRCESGATVRLSTGKPFYVGTFRKVTR